MALQKLDRRFDSDPRLDKSRNPDGLRLFHPADGRAWRQNKAAAPFAKRGAEKALGKPVAGAARGGR